jgi:tetratricopeptide (TPR) repeat protein
MRHRSLLGRASTDSGRRRAAVQAWATVVATVLTLAAPFAGAPPVQAAEKARQLHFGVDMARRGLWSEALFRFTRADQEDPGNPRIINNLAVAHEAVGQFDEAMELYKRAVELDPANADMKRNYARFVEFYQGFRPRDSEGESAEQESPASTESAEGESDADGAPEPEKQQPDGPKLDREG